MKTTYFKFTDSNDSSVIVKPDDEDGTRYFKKGNGIYKKSSFGAYWPNKELIELAYVNIPPSIVKITRREARQITGLSV